ADVKRVGVAGRRAVAVDLDGAAGQRALDVEGVAALIGATQQNAVVYGGRGGRIIEAPRGRVVNGCRSETGDAVVGDGDGGVAARSAVIADDEAIVRAAATPAGQCALSLRETLTVPPDVKRVGVAGLRAVAVDFGRAAGQGALDVEGVAAAVGA